MSVRTLSRRQVLVGAGGFGLGLPILHSILPRELRAQGLPVERRFVAFATDHGGVDESAMYPAESLIQNTEPLYTGHDVQSGALASQVVDGMAMLSEVLRAPADRLSDDLLSRMNVLRGLDIPWYIAHHTGGHLGNYARNDGNGEQGVTVQDSMMPTIDQLMAWSGNFYGDLSGIIERSMIFGGGDRLSYNWSSPSERSGDIQEIAGTDDPLSLFNRIFVPDDGEEEMGPAPRAAIVDRVHASFLSLRQSDRRLSTEDRQRLDDHMDRLSELQRRLNTTVVRRTSCGDAAQPSGNSTIPDQAGANPAEYYGLVNDVIAAGFLCGTSRIAVVKVYEDTFADYSGDWHDEVAHQHFDSGPQALLREVTQKVFQHALVDLAYKLNVEEAEGQTVLDNSLLQWTQESGQITHDNRSTPTVTFGGAGGSLNTGLYCDYRKKTDAGFTNDEWGDPLGYSGLLYSQWLATALQAMGLNRSEFQDIRNNGDAGYAYPFVGDHYMAVQSSGVVENASDILPFLST